MRLTGSCHCQAVQFTVDADHPYPFNRCYCEICRKTAGGGGYAINLGALADSLEVEGREAIRIYQARIRDEQSGEIETSPGQRHFCGECGSALWVWDPRWPELIHPHASAIDTPLPVPPERMHMMLDSAREWVEPDTREGDRCFGEYPDESLADWHKRLGL